MDRRGAQPPLIELWWLGGESLSDFQWELMDRVRMGRTSGGLYDGEEKGQGSHPVPKSVCWRGTVG